MCIKKIIHPFSLEFFICSSIWKNNIVGLDKEMESMDQSAEIPPRVTPKDGFSKLVLSFYLFNLLPWLLYLLLYLLIMVA